jgi:hypothetical protein
MIIIILNVDVFTCLCSDIWMHYRESVSFIYSLMKRFVLPLRSFSSFYFHCFSSYICNLLRMNHFIYFCFLNLLDETYFLWCLRFWLCPVSDTYRCRAWLETFMPVSKKTTKIFEHTISCCLFWFGIHVVVFIDDIIIIWDYLIEKQLVK